jgi:ABC-type Mn2+/Zn2+ transport system permease subunit
MMAWATGIGCASVYLGLLVSYHLDYAGSASIVVVAVAAFFGVLLIQTSRNATSAQTRRRTAATVPA